LSGWLYSTYLNNVYFQTYVDSLSPVFVPVLSVAFGISSASIATYLYLGMKRIQTLHEPETLVQKKVQARRAPRRRATTLSSKPSAVEPSEALQAKPKSILSTPPHVQTQKPPLREREETGSSANKGKQL